MRESVRDFSSQPVRNLYQNPSFETVSGTAPVWTNSCLNPSLDYVTNGTTALRTNLATNPSSEGGVSAFTTAGSGATYTVDSTRAFVGTSSTRISTTAGSSGGFKSPVIAVQPNTTYTISFYAYLVSGTMTGTIISGSDYALNQNTIPSGTLAAGAWTRYSRVYTTTSGQYDLFVWGVSSNVAVYHLDALLVEQTDQVRPYFDGSTTAALGWTYAWTGTANASTSTAKALHTSVVSNSLFNPSGEGVLASANTVRTNLAPNPHAVVAVGWNWTNQTPLGGAQAGNHVTTNTKDGGPAYQVTAGDGSGGGDTNLRIGFLSGAYSANVIPGASYTASLDVYAPHAINARIEINFKSGASTDNYRATAIQALVPGWNRLSGTVVAPTNANGIIQLAQMLSVGQPTAGSVWTATRAMIEQTDQVRPYFDGTSTSTTGWTYAWSGTANASPSTARAATTPVYQNLVTNPSGEYASAGTLYTRTNLLNNPNFLTNTTGWNLGWNNQNSGQVSRDTTMPGVFSGYSLKITTTTANSGLSSGVELTQAVVGGLPYTTSFYIKFQSGSTIEANLWATTSGSSFQAVATGNPINGWQRYTATGTANTNQNSVIIDIHSGGAGDVYWISNVLIEQTDQTRPYFDGSTTVGALGWTNAWVGTAGASASTSKALAQNAYTNLFTNPSAEVITTGVSTSRINMMPNPLSSVSGAVTGGWTTTNTGGGSGTTTWNTTQLALASTSTVLPTSNQWTIRFGTNGGPQAGSNRISVTPGMTYTQSVYVMSTIADNRGYAIDWADASGNAIGSAVNSTIALPANTWVRFTVTGTAPVNAVSASIHVVYTGTGAAVTRTVGSTIYLRQAMFEATDQVRPYFDGATTANGTGWAYAWTGTAGLSTSTAKSAIGAIRTNLHPNPSFEITTNLATYGTAARWSASTTQRYAGAQSIYVAPQAGDTGAIGYTLAPASYMPVTAGSTYTASAWAYKATPGGTVAIGINWYDAAKTFISGGSYGGTYTQTTANVWQRGYWTQTAPANAAYAEMILFMATYTGGTDAAYFDAAQFELGPTANTYFDGSIGSVTGSGDFQYYWQGTPNDSASQQFGIPVANVVTPDAYAISSWDWNAQDTLSMRVIPRNINNDSFASAGSDTGGFAIGMAAGRTYTAIGTIRLTAPQTGTLHTRARRIVVFYRDSAGNYQEVQSTQAANAAGTTILSVTAAIPATATEAFVRFYNGASISGGDVWWDKMAVIDGTYTSYFDGNSVPSGDLQVSWTGTALASTSVLRGVSVQGWTTNYSGTAQQPLVYASFIRGNRNVRSIAVPGDTAQFKGGVYYLGILAAGTYTASAKVWMDSGFLVNTTSNSVAIVANGTGVTSVATPSGFPSSTITSGAWVELRQTFVANGTGGVNLVVFANANSVPGKFMYIDDVMVTPNLYTGPYFDGDSASSGDLLTTWNGVAHNSVSEMRGVVPNWWPQPPNNRGKIVLSWDWAVNGSTSLRYIPTTPTDGTTGSTYINVPASLPTVSGLPYTIYGKVRLTQTLTTGTTTAPTLTVTAGSGTAPAVTMTATATNAAGVYDVRGSFTANATDHEIRFYCGSVENGGSVWWDSLMLVPGTAAHTGPYFDGDTPSAGDFTNIWAGTTYNSGSIQAAPAIANTQTVGPTTRVWQGYDVINGYVGRMHTEGAIVNNGTNRIAFSNMPAMSNNATYTAVLVASATASGSWSLGADSIGEPLGSGTFTIGTTPTTIYRTFVVPATGNFTNIYSIPRDTAAQQSTLTVYGFMLVNGTYSGPYFDGATPLADTDFTTAWSGAAHASTTVATAPVPSNVNIGTVQTYAFQSSSWSMNGGKSLRQIAAGSANAPVVNELQNPWPALIPGRTYTAMITSRTTGNFASISNNRRGLTARFYGSSTQPDGPVSQGPATAGVYQHRIVFRVPTDSTTPTIRWTSGWPGDPDVWWDNLMIVEGNYQGPYLDGSMPDMTWEGTAQASFSKGFPPSPNAVTNVLVWPNFDPSGQAPAVANTLFANLASGSAPSTRTYDNIDVPGARTGGYALIDTLTSAGTMGRRWTPTTVVQPGDTISMSMWIKSSVAYNAYPCFEFSNYAGGYVGTFGPASPVAVAANVWTKLTYSMVVPNNANKIRTVGFYDSGSVVQPAGTVIKVANGMCTVNQPLPDSYCDGNTPGWKWTGTPGLSTSYGYAPSLESIAGAPYYTGSNLASGTLVPLTGGYTNWDAPLTVYQVAADSSPGSVKGFYEIRSPRQMRMMWSGGTPPTTLQPGRFDTNDSVYINLYTPSFANNTARMVTGLSMRHGDTTMDMWTSAGSGGTPSGGSTATTPAVGTVFTVGTRDSGINTTLTTEFLVIYRAEHTLAQKKAVVAYLANRFGAVTVA